MIFFKGKNVKQLKYKRYGGQGGINHHMVTEVVSPIGIWRKKERKKSPSLTGCSKKTNRYQIWPWACLASRSYGTMQKRGGARRHTQPWWPEFSSVVQVCPEDLSDLQDQRPRCGYSLLHFISAPWALSISQYSTHRTTTILYTPILTVHFSDLWLFRGHSGLRTCYPWKCPTMFNGCLFLVFSDSPRDVSSKMPSLTADPQSFPICSLFVSFKLLTSS